MISSQASTAIDYEVSSSTGVPSPLPPIKDLSYQSNFLYQKFKCEQSPSPDDSLDIKTPIKYELATVISLPNTQYSRTFEYNTLSSPVSPSSTSTTTSSCSNYFDNYSLHNGQVYQPHIDQKIDVSQQYSTQSSHYFVFRDDQEHFFNGINITEKHRNKNSTCLNVQSELSDLHDFHSLPFETDIHNNNSRTNELSGSREQSFFDSRLKISSSKTSPSDTHGKGTRLPPFSALLSNSSAKQGVSESTQIMMKTFTNMFDEDSDANMGNSYSSMDEETHYTNLTNVGQTSHEQDTWYIDEPNYYLELPGDYIGLDPNIPFDSCEDMNIDPATPDSDGYESSSADIISSSQYVSIENSADLKFNSQSHVYRQDEIGTFTQIYSGHESSSSDEGYGEGNLPDFEKLQNRPDPDKVSQRKRNNALNSKAKKRTTKESVPFIEKERRKPGRKPGQVSNVLHLWEFMRNLLQNSEYEGIIEWISKSEGVFRVMNSTEVARLWGEKKKNKKQMTYEKLSRSLRYSRLEGYFAELPRDKNYPKKLCFKFGPKSRNWC